MRRKKSGLQSQTVSLFPFLAVLICTFGVLIILLVIVVKAADVQAENVRQQQEQNHQKQIATIQDDLELQKIRVEGIRSIRPELVNKLKAEKTQRAHIQADIERLTQQMKLVAKEISILKDNGIVENQNELQSELAILKRQLADEQDLLEKRRLAASSKAETRFSVVPYDAPGGTQRRPIYIECLADGFVIQPYGIRLTQRDFVQPILPNNPLDAALISVREYFLQNELIEQDAPYPLLIVRPEGAGTYALARHAIKTWDEEFGYELIPAEMELDYGEADPQLKKQIEVAIDAAKRRQDEYVVQNQLEQARRNQAQIGFASGGLQASGRFGGFVKPDGRVLQASGQQVNAESNADDKSNQTPGDQIDGAEEQADIKVAGLDASGSIADEKGKNWALPSSGDGAIAYHRPVRVFLRPDSMFMNSDSRSSKSVTVSLDNPRTALEDLVEAIWVRMDSWGVAGVGGYWKPELSVIVLPGAEEKFHEIKRLLADSGFDVREYKP